MKSSSEKEVQEVPIEIPIEQLSEEVLTGIIHNFIMREGTDYGLVEVSLDKKTEQIRKQLSKGLIKIFFDQSTETVTLIEASKARAFQN